MNYNSVKVEGHDYSFALADILPVLIGESAKNVNQIADEAGRSKQSVRHLMSRLHKKGVVHIPKWERGNFGPYMPHFLWGSGEDAIRPEAIPNAVKHKKYRMTEKGKATCRKCKKRYLKSEHGREYFQGYNKARWAREKFSAGGVTAIDPLLAAIMGVR